jgi:ABC-type multidrug transport system ATPase subunit
MKAMLLLTASGALVILTSHQSATDPGLLDRLRVKGIGKFIAYEIPVELVRQRYAGHFSVVEKNLDESDDLRVLDFDGQRAFKLFQFSELGSPIVHEGNPSV